MLIFVLGMYTVAIIAFIGFLVYYNLKVNRDKTKRIEELTKKLAAAEAELNTICAKHGLGKR